MRRKYCMPQGQYTLNPQLSTKFFISRLLSRWVSICNLELQIKNKEHFMCSKRTYEQDENKFWASSDLFPSDEHTTILKVMIRECQTFGQQQFTLHNHSSHFWCKVRTVPLEICAKLMCWFCVLGSNKNSWCFSAEVISLCVKSTLN